MAFRVTSQLPDGWQREVITELAGQHHVLGIVASAKQICEREGRQFKWWHTRKGLVIMYTQMSVHGGKLLGDSEPNKANPGQRGRVADNDENDKCENGNG